MPAGAERWIVAAAGAATTGSGFHAGSSQVTAGTAPRAQQPEVPDQRALGGAAVAGQAQQGQGGARDDQRLERQSDEPVRVEHHFAFPLRAWAISRSSSSSSRSPSLSSHPQQRADRADRGAVEEHLDHLSQRRLARGRFGQGRRIDEAAFGRLADDEALVFEPLEHRPDGRAGDLVLQRVEDFANEAGSLFVEDVDDLSFARRQGCKHERITSSYICSVVLQL